jgi:hypothetical protein
LYHLRDHSANAFRNGTRLIARVEVS